MSKETTPTSDGISGSNTVSPKKPEVQNASFAIMAGFGAMLASIALWALIAQKFQMPWFGVVLAYGIANAMRYFGKVVDKKLGIFSALFSLITVICGNVMTTIFILGKVYDKTPFEMIAKINIGQALLETFRTPVGVLFYLSAIIVGFWFSYKHPPKMVEVQL